MNSVEAIQSQDDVTPEAVKALRAQLKLTQEGFWPPVCVPAMRGCHYETKRTPIPVEIKRLIYLHHVLGIPTDIKAGDINDIAETAKSVRIAQREIEKAEALVAKAGNLLGEARGIIDAKQ